MIRQCLRYQTRLHTKENERSTAYHQGHFFDNSVRTGFHDADWRKVGHHYHAKSLWDWLCRMCLRDDGIVVGDRFWFGGRLLPKRVIGKQKEESNDVAPYMRHVLISFTVGFTTEAEHCC